MILKWPESMESVAGIKWNEWPEWSGMGGRNGAEYAASQARANLYKIIDETAESHEPVLITGKRNNAVLMLEDDWKAIQEAIYLNSIPGMPESIVEGMNTPIEECSEKLD